VQNLQEKNLSLKDYYVDMHGHILIKNQYLKDVISPAKSESSTEDQ
jgi:hypothetical protein